MKKVVLHVPDDKLHPLIQYLEAIGVRQFTVIAQVQDQPDVTVVPTASPPKLPAPKSKAFSFVGGRRNKGISSVDLVMQVLSTSPTPIVNLIELQTEFIKHGFSKNSVNSALTQLTRDRRVVRVSEGHYSLRIRHVSPDAFRAAEIAQ